MRKRLILRAHRASSENFKQRLRKAVEAATGGDVADRIQEATVGVVWRQVHEQVDPGVLFQLDEAFGFSGTQDDPMQAVADSTHDALREAVEQALPDK